MIEIRAAKSVTIGTDALEPGALVASIVPAVAEVNPEELLGGIQAGRYVARRVDDPRDPPKKTKGDADE